MSVATLHIQDEVNVRLKGLDEITIERIQHALTFYVPNFQFMPAYKIGRWDGKISYATKTGKTYLNLLDVILPIIDDEGYQVVIQDDRADWSGVHSTLPVVKEDYWGDTIYKGKPLVLRDYQVEAINTCIDEGNGMLEIATGGGKTLICATLCKVFSAIGNVILIVPSIDLAVQTMDTFQQVGIDAGLWYGEVKNRKQVTVSTWQSLEDMPELWAGVNMFIVDETHNAKAKTLTEILTGPGANCPFRFGCTGTIPKEEIYRFQLRANIGPRRYSITSYMLQEKGVLADADILQIRFKDEENPRFQNADFEDFNDFLSWIMTDEYRSDAMAALINEVVLDGNTLILVPHKKHGKALEALIPGSISIDGDIKADKRKKEYDKFEHSDDNILICTYGIASTGIDIPRIFNLILIEPGKKFEKVMQSLGRGLRKAEGKDFINVLDLASNAGMTRSHAKERVKLFQEAKQKVEVMELDYMTC